ncbi:GH25 family lysozyme [uncultured Clostridium sp.]|uniref:GH25 family lysozyme n=1 Tax=uncultured Clostridium sp. TaxID=59620 RepID=UPI0028F0DA7A|nr:GH25 family lysozyme [uncultured Clostridium sp.]
MKGIDVSNYNGNINFNKVKAAGIEAVYIKATEGTTNIDSYVDTNYSNAHYAGLKTGFYHFLVGTSAPETQATNFYNCIKDKASDLTPMLDVETAFDGLMDYALRFISKFKKISNMNIGIYTYTGFMSNLDDRLASYPLWEADYNDDSWNLPSNFFVTRVGHQYSEKGSVDGVNTDCDMNEFNEGVLTALAGEWIQGTEEDSGKWWYKHSDSSYTKADWEHIDGEWYYFDYKGWMCTGWLLVKGITYCCYSDGKMIHDTIAYGYSFDSNGVATKTS